jgi:hypothetical protein
MAERRARSLLDFAIAASIAVVPIMLAMLLLVAVIRPADPGAWHGQAERYVSVRQVAALKTFERAIVQRPAPAFTAPSAAQLLAGLPLCGRDWGAGWQASRWLPAGKQAVTPSTAERVAAQLAALDAALLRFSSRDNARVGHALGFDATRWFAAAGKSLGTAIESAEYPGQQFQLRCADLAAALAALARDDGRLLDALAWRGTEGSVALARWRPEQQVEITARQVMRRNPWSGIAGCIYLGRDDAAGQGMAPTHFLAGARSVQRRVCAMPAMAAMAGGSPAAGADAVLRGPGALAGEPGLADALDDTRWMVPPSLHAMLQPLDALRQPSGSLYRQYTDSDALATGGPGATSSASPAGVARTTNAATTTSAASSSGTTSAASGAPAAVRNAANRIVLDGAPIDIGFAVELTIDPVLQALAQKTAACYTGRHDVCDALGLRRSEDTDKRGRRPIGEPLLEGAMVRMAAVAVIDVASGRIEALAGAMSPCARQEVDGPGRDPTCDRRLPYPVQYRPDALLNPAVYHDAMPASTIKPIMAAAFLSDPLAGARWLAAERAAMQREGAPARNSLRGQLMRSDSARFLDRMFCIESDFAHCRRPWEVQALALDFGWNAGCADARADCGKHDLLFGAALDAGLDPGLARGLSTRVAYGRLMSEPVIGKTVGKPVGRPAGKSAGIPAAALGAAMHLRPPAALDAAVLRRCAAGADGRRLSDDDWEKCRGGAVVDVVAEGWGQGHARASALGIAGMMATLAAAANGQAEVRRPHLVESLHGVAGADHTLLDAAVQRWTAAAARPNRLSHDAAEVILSALSYSHRSGTARSACEQVFDARRCRDIDWLAGKTGTPSFPSDGLSLDELVQLCRGGAAAQDRAGTCSSLRPYKWYVAAYRADGAGSGPWTKVIAVLSERNWLRQSGHVHGAGDHGPNPSAEIAMQIAGRQVGLIAAGAP